MSEREDSQVPPLGVSRMAVEEIRALKGAETIGATDTEELARLKLAADDLITFHGNKVAELESEIARLQDENDRLRADYDELEGLITSIVGSLKATPGRPLPEVLAEIEHALFDGETAKEVLAEGTHCLACNKMSGHPAKKCPHRPLTQKIKVMRDPP